MDRDTFFTTLQELFGEYSREEYMAYLLAKENGEDSMTPLPTDRDLREARSHLRKAKRIKDKIFLMLEIREIK